MKLLLDNHYSPLIAENLREKGHDVVAAVERGWEEEPDEALLGLAVEDGRAVLTNNVSDFTLIVRRWAVAGRSHNGLIFTADRSRPRGKHAIGRYVEALDQLLATNEDGDAFMDRVHWL